MNYYKIIVDNQIVGAVSSKSFIKYVPIANCFERCDEQQGEYISYKGNLYRDTWMHPTFSNREFITTTIVGIDEEEYNLYVKAIENNGVIMVEEEEEEEPENILPEDPNDAISLEFIRSSKLKELSRACRTTIEAGIDIDIRDETKHFSLNTQDQLNLMSLEQMIQHQSMVPYHADGEEVVFYSAEEMQEIIDSANAFKIYHTTYHNALKGWVNALDNIEDIGAIQYGDEIPEQYKTDVLKALEV